MRDLLSSRVSAVDGWVLLVLAGETDLSVEQQLFDAIDTAIDAAPIGVRLDLTGVTFFDSCGLRSLVRGRRRAAQCGRAFRIAATSSIVDRVLQISGLDGVFVTDERPDGTGAPQPTTVPGTNGSPGVAIRPAG